MTRFWLQNALVGLGAGACSGLLFAALASKSIFSIGLFYLAPLPILMVALGWSHWAGLLAAGVAALSLAVAIDGFYFLAFLICVGIPAWWLGYLALLARPTAPQGGADTVEWYPPGRLVLWCATLGALIVLIGLAQIGPDEATIREALRGAIETLLQQVRGATDSPVELPGWASPERLALVLPPAAAALTTTIQLLNLWLAGRIVLLSGRLRRPWPEFSALRFPAAAPIALAAALGGSFLPGTVGLVAALAAASLLIAYAVLGFAVMHGITRHLPHRPVMLLGTYAVVAVFGWPVLLMALLGVIDSALDLRARVAAARGPPAPLA
jgi:Predicted membrane protein (DUF2232)